MSTQANPGRRLDSPRVNPIEPQDFAALIGIDWTDQKHDVCLIKFGSDQREHASIEHTPEALTAWVNRLRQRFDGRQVAVCLEQSRGALIYALMKYACLTLFPHRPGTTGLLSLDHNPLITKPRVPFVPFLQKMFFIFRTYLLKFKELNVWTTP